MKKIIKYAIVTIAIVACLFINLFVYANKKNEVVLSFSAKNITVEKGKKTTVKITRKDKNLDRLQLGLVPSSESNLWVSGGLFYDNQEMTEIVIEANKNSKSGSVMVIANNIVELLSITVE